MADHAKMALMARKFGISGALLPVATMLWQFGRLQLGRERSVPLGVFSLSFGIVLGILAIVFAGIALSGGGEEEKGAAITGLILGILAPILGIVAICF